MLAVIDNGSLAAWGSNEYGQLGKSRAAESPIHISSRRHKHRGLHTFLEQSHAYQGCGVTGLLSMLYFSSKVKHIHHGALVASDKQLGINEGELH